MFSISEFVKNFGSELNIRGSHRRMSLPEVQDTDNLMNGFQGYDQSHEDFMSTCVRCRKTIDTAKADLQHLDCGVVASMVFRQH